MPLRPAAQVEFAKAALPSFAAARALGAAPIFSTSATEGAAMNHNDTHTAARAAAALALVLLCTRPAAAGVTCTDDWGRSYSLPATPSAALVRFRCYEEQAKPAPVKIDTMGLALTALALPSPPPPPVVARGGMALWITTAPAQPAAAQPLDGMIANVAKKYGHDADLLKAIIHVESRFNANAVSPKGAIGLMQVMPATGQRVGIATPRTTLFDPEQNLHAGARYLRILMDMFPERPELAIAAYNAGEGAVLRHKRAIPPYPETQAYVRDVLANYQRYRAL
jgi:soluble lytic murein transglycosylase-like protein